MADGLSIGRSSGHQESDGRAGRPDFVELRNRIKRLVDSLVALRDLPPSPGPWPRDPESVEIELESDAVVVLGAGYSARIKTPLNDFSDHFEVFVTGAAKTLFPPIVVPRREKPADVESWYKELGRAFEATGCRVPRDAGLCWKDLAGLDDARERSC